MDDMSAKVVAGTNRGTEKKHCWCQVGLVFEIPYFRGLGLTQLSTLRNGVQREGSRRGKFVHSRCHRLFEIISLR